MADGKRIGFRVLAIGDPHFKERNAEQTCGMVDAIIRIARSSQPDLIVCLGDVLDRHARLHTDPLCEAIEFFRKLKTIAPLRIIIGNHDRRNNSDFMTDRHPFTAIKNEWTNTLVADQVLEETLDGHKFVYVPYVPNGRFIEALKLGVDADLSDIYESENIDERNEIDDIDERNEINEKEDIDDENDEKEEDENDIDEKNDDRNEIDEKNDDEKNDDRNEKEDIDDEKNDDERNRLEELISSSWWFKSSIVFAHQEFYGAKMGHMISENGDKLPLNHPFVVTGHIHDYQRPQANILYTGTPIQHAFGDTVDKTISLLTWDGDAWEEERIDLGLIKRKCIRLKAHELATWQPPPGYIIKVIVEGTPGELRTVRSLPLIEKLRKQGVIVTIKTLPEQSTYKVGSSVRKTRTYLVNLYDRIEKQPHVDQMKYWYVDIFGRPTRLGPNSRMINPNNEDSSTVTITALPAAAITESPTDRTLLTNTKRTFRFRKHI
jgi:predicted phosphodiesterase